MSNAYLDSGELKLLAEGSSGGFYVLVAESRVQPRIITLIFEAPLYGVELHVDSPQIVSAMCEFVKNSSPMLVLGKFTEDTPMPTAQGPLLSGETATLYRDVENNQLFLNNHFPINSWELQDFHDALNETWKVLVST